MKSLFFLLAISTQVALSQFGASEPTLNMTRIALNSGDVGLAPIKIVPGFNGIIRGAFVWMRLDSGTTIGSTEAGRFSIIVVKKRIAGINDSVPSDFAAMTVFAQGIHTNGVALTGQVITRLVLNYGSAALYPSTTVSNADTSAERLALEEVGKQRYHQYMTGVNIPFFSTDTVVFSVQRPAGNNALGTWTVGNSKLLGGNVDIERTR